MKHRKIRKFVPPAFFVMLAVSFVMWCLTQLSREYTGVEVPVTIKVEGNIFEVPCYASGSGFKLASHRVLHRTVVEVPFDELDVTPSALKPGWGMIDHTALTQAVARRVSDIKVERVGLAPEISLIGR